MADAIRQIGVSEVTYYRWRQEFGGLKTEQVKRCGAKPRSLCPLATRAFTENVFWADARPSIKMALLYVCESGKKVT
jgi:hypothetical protein